MDQEILGCQKAASVGRNKKISETADCESHRCLADDNPGNRQRFSEKKQKSFGMWKYRSSESKEGKSPVPIQLEFNRRKSAIQTEKKKRN
jgi:hypothetical protein